MSERERTTEEIQRGEIIRYLTVSFPAAATPKMLLYHLRDARYPCTYAGLKFHLEYLQAKGWVSLVYGEGEELGSDHVIAAAKATPQGIDFHDRRKEGDPGVKW